MSAIALDPLIAEARRRARRRRNGLLIVALATASALAYAVIPSGRSGPAGTNSALPQSFAARLALASRERLPLSALDYAGGGVDVVSAVNGDDWYSTNDGRSWHRRAANPASWINAPAEFVNRRDGWFQAGEYLDRTTDGGRTWTRLRLPEVGPFGDTVSGFQFLNRADGLLGVFRQSGGPDNLWVTHDGGTTWHLRGTLPPNGTGFDGFANTRLGFASRYTAVYATRDGGRTWKVVLRAPRCTATSRFGGAVVVVSSTVQVAQCGPSSWVSTDGGSSWSPRRVPGGYLDVMNTRTWVALHGMSVFVTTAAGRSWRRTGQLAVPPRWELDDIQFTSPRTAEAIFGLRPPPQHTPGIPGDSSYPSSDVLMRTTDGGRQWAPAGPLKPRKAHARG